MTTTTVREDIRSFAADVRVRLDDLPADDIDDLLDGLEADLSDQADEAGEAFEIPDAAAYADELRAAAGLPPRTASATKPRAQVRDRVAKWARRVRENRAVSGLLNFAASLRPVWWLVRAVALWLLATRPLGAEWVPDDPLSIASLLVFALVSIQWGRGKWLPTLWLKATRSFLDVVAILAIPFLVAGMNQYIAIAMVRSSASAAYESSTSGLAIEGARVRNIFAYDADGRPIERVQLFDQNGQPLTTVGPSGRNDDWDYYFYGGGGPTPVAEREIGRQPVWNIFPLRELAAPPYTSEPDLGDAIAPVFPFAQVPPLPAPLTDEDVTQANVQISPQPTESPVP